MFRFQSKRSNRRLRAAASAAILRHGQASLVEMLENRVLLSSYLVTSTADGPGVITPSASPGIDFDASTLRGAIIAANANPGADTISFDPSLSGQRIVLDGSELPAITDDLTITGPGAGQLTIDGKGYERIFEINSGATVGISRLTLTGGRMFIDGSAIANFGTLTVTKSAISGNGLSYLYVGSYSGNGGGIYNAGALTVIDSTISGNSSETGSGGGIYNGGTLSVVDSTISGNYSRESSGGGIYNGGTLSVIDSTISGNSANLGGGGIYNFGTLSVTNSTLVANRADSNNTGRSSNFGGGLMLYFFGKETLHNTIVAGNFRGDGATANDIGSIAHNIDTDSHNLIGDAATSGGISNGVNGNIVGVSDLTTVFVDVNHDGKIDASDLAANGGPTETYALAATSPAINAGDNSLAVDANGDPLQFDQRGAPFFARIFGGTVDIGAFEAQPIQPIHLVVDTTADVNNGNFGANDLSLREAIELANIHPDGNTISFDASLAGQKILLNGSELPTITNDLTITGLGENQLTIDAQGKSGIFEINSGATVAISGLTLTGGIALGYAYPGAGAIQNAGVLSVTASTISGNSGVVAANAGGIWNELGAKLTITDSTISRNSSVGGSGGIFNQGVLTITDSTISDNSADGNGGGIVNYYGTLSVMYSTISGNSGGGINDHGGTASVTGCTISGNSGLTGGISNIQGTLSIVNCTISDNAGGSYGGGIDNDYGTMTVTGSTISGNTVYYGSGGGIYNYYGTLSVADSTISGNSCVYVGGGISNSGTLFLTNSTIVANRADMYDYGSRGGGLAVGATGVTLDNTIVAGNVRGTGGTPDDISWYYGTMMAASHNLIGDAATSGGISNGVNGNIVGVSDLTTVFVDVNHDGKIDASDLANNGGPTKTYALAATSPAINAGDNSLAVDANGDPLQFDQRGEGFDRIVAGTVDIGAFEVQTLAPEELVNLINGTIQDLFASGVIDRGQQEALTLTLRDNSGDAGKVQALLNETEAFVLGDVLTQQQANGLLDLGNILLLELTTV